MNRTPVRRLHPVRPLGSSFQFPSDTVSWLDCVDYDEPGLDPVRAGAWGQDWARTWTLERLDEGQAETVRSTVAGTGTSAFDSAESIRRMTNRYAQTNRTGVEFMTSTGRHHVFESLTEQAVLKQIDMCRPLDLVSQPFWLHWHDGTRARRHVPDFLVREPHGTTVVNVRPDGLVKDKDLAQFAALTAVANRLGWRHVVVGNFRRPHAVNVEALASARRDPHDPLDLQSQMMAALAHGPLPLGQVVAGTVAPALARAVLLGMVWRGEAAIDLAVLLGDRSAVRLGTAR